MSIHAKINDGYYTTKVAYPSSPKKPTIKAGASASEAREYANALEIYEAGMASVRESRKEYYADQARLEAELRADVENDNGIWNDHPAADKLWEMAWENGHSAGYGEVVNEYERLVELVLIMKVQR